MEKERKLTSKGTSQQCVHLILEIQTVHTEGYSVMDGSWKTDDWMDGWMAGRFG